MDPQAVDDMSHASAAALLDRVHHSQDPVVVQRVLTLVDTQGVDIIAELWSRSEPESLPGMLWRLYLLRTWMRRHQESLSRLWRHGEPVATVSSAVAGVDPSPEAEDIVRTADSILSGAFTGDFAVALERASAFTDVISDGLRLQAQRLIHRSSPDTAMDHIENADGQRGDRAEQSDRSDDMNARTSAARLMHTASNLMVTSQDFQRGANLWRRGRLE